MAGEGREGVGLAPSCMTALSGSSPIKEIVSRDGQSFDGLYSVQVKKFDKSFCKLIV